MNDLLPLTHKYETAVSAHKILEQIIDLQCMIAKSTFYRQPKSNDTVLKIAHEEDY
jgi:hypothetical protein